MRFCRFIHFSRRNFKQFIEVANSHGYASEKHTVKTSDGYLLTLHRIPRGIKHTHVESKGVTLLEHGLFCSSVDWIVCGPGRSLPYMLVEKGFDVWLGNSRGNSFSRQHVSLDPEKKDFWQFTQIQDANTGRKSLNYIGYSQGSTAFFVMASMRQEYNDKIDLFQALAPVASLSNTKSQFVKILASFATEFQLIFNLLGYNELLHNKLIRKAILNDRDASTRTLLFRNIILSIISKFGEQIDAKLLEQILINTPAGASLNQIIHYAQCMNSGKFSQFDYGTSGNMQKYTTNTPPEYPLHKITAPTILHFADQDIFTSTNDVEKLTKKLPNLVGNFRVTDSNLKLLLLY